MRNACHDQILSQDIRYSSWTLFRLWTTHVRGRCWATKLFESYVWRLVLTRNDGCFSGTQKCGTTVLAPPSSWWAPSWTCERTRRPSRSSRRRNSHQSHIHRWSHLILRSLTAYPSFLVLSVSKIFIVDLW